MQERRVIKGLLVVLLVIFMAVSVFDRALVSWKYLFGTKPRDWTSSYAWDLDSDERSIEWDWDEYGSSTSKLDESKFVTLNPREMSDVNRVMKDRRNNIARICDEDLKTIGLGMDINPKFMIYDKSHHLAYCAIPKVASSSWTHNFLIMGGLSPLKFSHRAAPKRLPFPLDMSPVTFAQDVTSMMIVRHPFSRLASAYYDKLIRLGRKSWQMVRLFIIWKFRLPPPKRHFESWMADQLIQEHERELRNGTIAHFSPRDPSNASPEEFAQYLLFMKNRPMDIHFRPQHKICPICAYNFTAYCQMEHLHRDASYFLQKANATRLLQTRIHLNSREFPSQRSKRQSETDFWSQINPTTQQELFQLYFYDFQLFGYSLPDYMADIGLKSSWNGFRFVSFFKSQSTGSIRLSQQT